MECSFLCSQFLLRENDAKTVTPEHPIAVPVTAIGPRTKQSREVGQHKRVFGRRRRSRGVHHFYTKWEDFGEQVRSAAIGIVA